jgi:N-acetylmuramoyl-L-alanine amidase
VTKTHRIVSGECFSSLTSKYGFPDVQNLYAHGDNSQLKSKRPNPNVLKPGDRVKIPDKEQKEESCGDSKKHRFKVKGLVTHLRILVEDFEGTALDNKEYELEIEAQKFEGKTDGSGLVEQIVKAEATVGRLRVWLDDEKTKSVIWPLDIGALAPHDEISGAQARLNNLGFDSGPVDGIIGPKTKAAVAAFNKKHTINDGDNLGDQTKNKLKELFGF